MAAHPVEAARIEGEMQRRRSEESERAAKLALDTKVAEERRRREAEQAIKAALAVPLSTEKQKILSEMQFPPSLADLERFARSER